MSDNNENVLAAKSAAASRTFTPRVSSADVEPGVTTRTPSRSLTPNNSSIPDLDLTSYADTINDLSNEDTEFISRIAQPPLSLNSSRVQDTSFDDAPAGGFVRNYIHHSLHGKTLQGDIDTIKSLVIKSSN